MSKYNNVNPGQYKVGGREKPDTLARARQKAVGRKAGRLSKPLEGRKSKGKKR